MTERSPQTAGAARSRKLFLALGIDVWVQRRADGAPAAVPIAGTHPAERASEGAPALGERDSSAPAHAPTIDTATAEPDSPVAAPPDAGPWPSAFTIHCFHLGDVFVAVDETLWNRRRFFGDVARAFNGFAKADRALVRFDWPQGGLATGADRAFQAFYRHQGNDARHRIVCGPLSAGLLGHDAPSEVGALGDALYLDGQTTPSVKRRIWEYIAGQG